MSKGINQEIFCICALFINFKYNILNWLCEGDNII